LAFTSRGPFPGADGKYVVLNPYASGVHRALLHWHSQTAVTRGILLMCLSTVAFAIMHASVRYVSADFPPFQIAFFRNLFGLAFLVPFFVGAGFTQMRTRRLGLHAFRGLINVCAMLMVFTSLSITPLATVTALSFTAPIFATVLSFFFLGERFRLYRWMAIVVGFLGMLIILRPGNIALEPGALLAAGAAVLWAIAMIVTKNSVTYRKQRCSRRLDGHLFVCLLNQSGVMGLADSIAGEPVMAMLHWPMRLHRSGRVEPIAQGN
jgi:drug/metabolite transporter (DMT)-like permease